MMKDERTESSKAVGVAASAVGIVLLLLVLYVLSTGPVIWVLSKLDVDPNGAGKVLEAFYFPLQWIYEATEGTSLGFIAELLNSYVDLFA